MQGEKGFNLKQLNYFLAPPVLLSVLPPVDLVMLDWPEDFFVVSLPLSANFLSVLMMFRF